MAELERRTIGAGTVTYEGLHDAVRTCLRDAGVGDIVEKLLATPAVPVDTTTEDSGQQLCHFCGRQIPGVPADFVIPDCPVRHAWALWMCGNKAKQVPPLRHLDGHDMLNRKMQKRLSQLRYSLLEMRRQLLERLLLGACTCQLAVKFVSTRTGTLYPSLVGAPSLCCWSYTPHARAVAALRVARSDCPPLGAAPIYYDCHRLFWSLHPVFDTLGAVAVALAWASSLLFPWPELSQLMVPIRPSAVARCVSEASNAASSTRQRTTHSPILRSEAPTRTCFSRRSGGVASSRFGGWPLVIFSHGLAGSLELYSYVNQQLASHGYVVVVPNHCDGSACVCSPEPGRIEYYQQSQRTDSVFRRCDLTNVSVAGHSFGAATALTAAHQDARFKKMVLLDAWMEPLDHDVRDGLGPRVPALHLMSEHFLHWRPNAESTSVMHVVVPMHGHASRGCVARDTTISRTFPCFRRRLTDSSSLRAN
ncbi:Alpha/beta hydrolase fold-5 [Phytophthora cactorum]|nr:Alpha/beta hydrolase fold-5 [Phytophthora cactorum]